MENNVLLEKSLAFAARIVKVYRYLSEQQHETVLSQQLLRSGTSIGANANEAVYAAVYAVSKADFISKLHISLKETAETEYWLRLLTLSQYLTAAESQSLLTDCLELKRILIAILKTSKSTSEPPAT